LLERVAGSAPRALLRFDADLRKSIFELITSRLPFASGLRRFDRETDVRVNMLFN
jgi:hypothetical protein